MTTFMSRKWSRHMTPILAVAGLATGTLAVDYPEVEPNESRAAATVVATLKPGDSVSGVTTGSSTTTPGNGSADYFLLNIAPATAGIYRNQLTVTATSTAAYSVSIPGLAQAAKTITTTESTSVFSNTSSTPRYVQWYGFGKGESINFRITGSASTNGTYTATYTSIPIGTQDIATVFAEGVITVSTVGQTTVNTEFFVYDSNFNPVIVNGDFFGNNDESVLSGGTGVTSQSLASRFLTQGTYYIAISSSNLANNLALAFDDDVSADAVHEYPDFVTDSSSSINQDVDLVISDTAGNSVPVSATKVSAYDVVWVKFVVGTLQTLSVTPNVSTTSLTPGDPILFTLTVTPLPIPLNTITTVTSDLSAYGGSATQQMFDDGTSGDAVANDGIYSYQLNTSATIPPGARTASYSVSDDTPRTVTGNYPSVTITPVVPPNDDCATATVLSEMDLPYTATVGIRLAGPEAPIECSASTSPNNGIWYKYTAGADGILEVRETGSRDVSVVIYDGDCSGTTLLCETTETDANYPVQGGHQYSILIVTPGMASNNNNDTYAISIKRGNTSAPVNDLCSGAIPLVPDVNAQIFPAGGATPDALTSCQTLTSMFARNGIWFTYTTGTDDVVARFRRTSTSPSFSVQLLTGTCGSLAEYDCIDLGTGSPGEGVALHKNTKYYLMVHRRTGYMSSTGEYEILFSIENYPQVPNQDCATATPITLPFTDLVNNTLAFDDPPVNDCHSSTQDGPGADGIWYTFTPAAPTNVLVEETSSGTDVVVAAFEGSCFGPRVMCAFTDTNTSESNRFRAYPLNTYYIFYSMQTNPVGGLPNGTSNPIAVSITGNQVPVPSNDDCETATEIVYQPFSSVVPVGTAHDDLPHAICAGATATLYSRSGIWYKYTNGPNIAAAVMSENSGYDAFIAAYKGSCGNLEPVMCTDVPDTNMYLYMQPNTTYYLLIGQGFDGPASGTAVVDFTFDLIGEIIHPPANQDCSSAQLLTNVPITYTSKPLASSHDPVSSCANEPLNLSVNQATNPLWYEIRSGTGFELNIYETSTISVNYALYTGECGALSEVYCNASSQGTASNPVGSGGTSSTSPKFILEPDTTYYLVVARDSNDDLDLTSVNYNLVVTVPGSTTGLCRAGGGCLSMTFTDCTTAGGTFFPGRVPCPGDFNCTGGVEVADIFAFLNAWFAQFNVCSGFGNCSADISDDGSVEVADIFAFLNQWFGQFGRPCP